MKISQILEFLNTKNIPFHFEGDVSVEIEGFSSLKNYKEKTFTWAKNELAYQFDFSNKLLVIAQEGLDIKAQNVIFSQQSKLAFFSLVEYMADGVEQAYSGKQIGDGTIIGADVEIGNDVIIGSNCVIEGKIKIGDHTRIWNQVTIINQVTIGESCEIQSGCVIGHDGFAWNEDDSHVKTMIRHFGGVEIGDHVYIGPNGIIDRGEIDNTIIKKGAKIDANCFIAHNVVVGENVILITGCRLYGSSEIGNNAYIASATVRNQCHVGDHAFIGMGAVVTSHIPSNVVAQGVPAKVVKKEI